MAHKIIILKPDTLPLTSVRGSTPPFEKSLGEIKALLRKFSCGQMNLHEDYRGTSRSSPSASSTAGNST